MDEVIPLDGAVVIVTGAGDGLGRAEALGLAACGARLVLNDVRGDTAHVVADEAKALGGEAVVHAGDVGDWATGEALVAAAVDAFGRLDALVNNAGVVRDRMVFTMSEQEWDLVLRVHLRGHFVTTRHATAYWRERHKSGQPTSGSIVNTSSEAFLLGSPGQPNYAAAKAGIVALTLATARSCARYGVRANAICPRGRTSMTADLMGEVPPSDFDPMAPEHVAPLVAYLASPLSRRVTGEVFVVHGGMAALLGPPTVRATFRVDGGWTTGAVRDALDPYFTEDPPRPGFLCQDTLPLAESTFDGPRP
ncbi:MAG TPA: SDR family NAD(P)-dependent oxidoreductase [Micromonosporaceae bacterium]|jgi:NAD(P)-dependent dehydrogenase (short-subunit alcohol dehydrogenase family)